MTCYAVIDTNVLVSSLLTSNPDSAIAGIINSIRDNAIIPMYDDHIMEEYSAVLRREKFNFDEGRVSRLISLIRDKGLNCERKTVEEFFPDPDDIVFYEVAMSREDSYLVTGNRKHFPKSGRVVSPAEMLYIIKYEGRAPDLLCEPESPYYLPIPIEEINFIIREFRTQRT